MPNKIFSISLTIILSSLVSVSGVAASEYHFEKSYPESSTKVSFKRLFTIEKDGVVVVKGTLKKRYPSSYTSKGHIDIAVYNPDGNLIEETTARYVPSLNSRKAHLKRGSRFSAALNLTPPTGSTIKVAFHSNAYRPTAKPKHKISIIKSDAK